MTGPQVIRMSFLENSSIEMIPTSAWEIKHTRRWRWLEHICWRIMLWTGCVHPHFDRNQLVRNVAIDTGKAAEEICRLAKHQLALIDWKPERVLLGRPQFDAIVGNPENFRRPFGFEIELARRENSSPKDEWRRYYDPGITIFRVPVQVVPWMDGVLVL